MPKSAGMLAKGNINLSRFVKIDTTNSFGVLLATVDDLMRMIEVNNARIAKTGDDSCVTIGHTKDDVPESEQPEVVGFARNYRLGKLKDKRVVLATLR